MATGTVHPSRPSTTACLCIHVPLSSSAGGILGSIGEKVVPLSEDAPKGFRHRPTSFEPPGETEFLAALGEIFTHAAPALLLVLRIRSLLGGQGVVVTFSARRTSLPSLLEETRPAAFVTPFLNGRMS